MGGSEVLVGTQRDDAGGIYVIVGNIMLKHSSIKVPMDLYGHLFEGDHRHVINLVGDTQEQAEPATPLQPALEVPLAFAYKQLENITN